MTMKTRTQAERGIYQEGRRAGDGSCSIPAFPSFLIVGVHLWLEAQGQFAGPGVVDDDPVAGLEAGAVEPVAAQADAGFDVLRGEVADRFDFQSALVHRDIEG